MIDDDERREIAARLRSIAGKYVTLGVLEIALEMDITSPDVDLDRDAKNIDRLAELIDRPTCRNVHGGREFMCSRCGGQWHLLSRADAGEEWAHARTPRYCPECGAEVRP